MDFESPDVERDFPGLYASESGSGKRSQESDFSDDAHERSTKKDLLIGKRKDKKESKKDLGYAALEGESSPEEDLDVKSPCKSKKSKSFKFPTIKEKREKSREKDVKEKDRDKEKEKDKDVDRDKEKKKEFKSKLKLKDKKKVKSCDDATESVEDMPVFGVSLAVATERSHCHDGVEIPVVVRDCIDHVQEHGLGIEGIYKIAGVKSKVQQLRRSYNKREAVNLADYDVPTVTSLLRTFLRELSDPLLTTDLNPRFEDVAAVKEPAAREQELSALIAQLPLCNRTCLSWIMRHLESVAANESQNKMGVSALSNALSMTLQAIPKVVSVLLIHSSSLFANVKLVRYIPPLSTGCTSLPNTREAIVAELAKQDSLLNQIHSEMNHGYTARSDLLWEVQRFITQLKRKLRSLEKALEVTSQSVDKAPSKSDAPVVGTPNSAEIKVAPVSPPVDKIDFQLQQLAHEEGCVKTVPGSDADNQAVKYDSAEVDEKPVPMEETDAVVCKPPTPVVAPAEPSAEELPPTPAPTASSDQTDNGYSSEADDKSCESESYLHLEQLELLKLQNSLILRLTQEREEVEALRAEFKSLTSALSESSPNVLKTSDIKTALEVSEVPSDNGNTDTEKLTKEKKELCEQNAHLMRDRLKLVHQIMLEQEACISLKVQLGLKQVVETK